MKFEVKDFKGFVSAIVNWLWQWLKRRVTGGG